MNYEALFSRAADTMRQSPIRQMGTVAAQRADLISFAPGYPGADGFAWDDYRAIADDLLTRFSLTEAATASTVSSEMSSGSWRS